MKYTYAYKTSDGVRHEAALESGSRDEVFAVLRRRGIKPIKVVAADGSKANGEVRGVRKSILWVVVVIAAGLLVALAFEWYKSVQLAENSIRLVQETPRHQLYGDPDVIGAFASGRFGAALPRLGDQALAWFAQPGQLMAPKTLSPRLLQELDETLAVEITAAIAETLPISEADSREVRELRQIVNGMHRELRDYLANGVGTVRSYWRRLHERYRQELGIYERIRRELEDERDPEVWEEKNEALRRIGLKTIPNPAEDADL